MRNICIIPARGNSKGILKKNLLQIMGKPLVAWSILKAKQSKNIHEVYVSSDSDEILNVARELGAIGIKRPESISGDTASSETALIHAYEEAISKNSTKVDYIVFLQPTSPVRKNDDIDKALDTIILEKSDSLLSVKALRDYFIWKKTDDVAQPLNFDYKNRKRRQEIETTYLENGSMYVFKPEILIENNNRLGKKISLFEMDPSCSFQIDDPSDIEVCEYFLRKMESL